MKIKKGGKMVNLFLKKFGGLKNSRTFASAFGNQLFVREF